MAVRHTSSAKETQRQAKEWKGLSTVPATVIAMLVSLGTMFGLVSLLDALVFSR